MVVFEDGVVGTTFCDALATPLHSVPHDVWKEDRKASVEQDLSSDCTASYEVKLE